MADSSAKKSTIVRAKPGMRLLVFAIIAAERVAPRLGARLATRLWLTMPPGRPASERPRLAEPGERGLLRLDGPHQVSVVTESWGNGPVIYLMHGWGGYRGQLGAFVGPLTEAGYRVVAVDAPGHGDSGPGRLGPGRGMLPEFLAALRAATRRDGPAHGVLAHSLGATAAALAVLDGLAARRLVLIAPASDPQTVIGLWAKMFRVGARVRARMPRAIERRLKMPMTHFDVVQRAAEAEDLPPALVIHDAADKEMPFAHGARVAGAWPDARLHGTKGLGHGRILRDPEVIRMAVAFLARPGTALD